MSRETWVQINGRFVCKARDGALTREYSRLSSSSSKNPFQGYGSDTLGRDVNGIINHADGKRYDSKSLYNKAVRAAGCVVVGNDLNNKEFKRPDVRGDFNVRPQLKEAVQRVLNQGH